MSTLSVCIIAHNEAENITRTLESVRWANEIIVVDCESSDTTREICNKYTEKVFSRDNISNLNINKNFSFDQSTCEWILCLDADEVIPENLKKEIQKKIESTPIENGFFIPRKNYFFGHWLKYGGQFPDNQLRLFKRGKGKFPEKHVHERIRIEGTVGKLAESFEHYPYKTISHFLKKLDFYSSYQAEIYERNKISVSFLSSFQYLFLVPIKRFISRYLLKLGFRDGLVGFLACFFDSTTQIVSYSKYYFLKKG